MIFNFSIKLVVLLCFLADICRSDDAPKKSRNLLQKITNSLHHTKNDRDLVAEGMKFFKQMKYKQATKLFTGAIRLNPEEPSYYVLRAHCFVELTAPQMAFTDFKLALSLAADLDKKETPISDITYFKELGSILFDKRKFTEAHWCYSELINIEPSNTLSFYKMMGDCSRSMEDYEKAILEYSAALKINQKDETARNALILTLYKVEKFDEAVENIFKLAEESDVIRWGTTFYKDKRSGGALKCFDEAIKRNANNEHSLEFRGKTYVLMGKIDLAISDFRRQVELSPEKLNGWLFLIVQMCKTGKMDQVMNATHGLNDMQLAKLGNAFFDEEKFDGALRLYDEAIKQNSSVASHFGQRGLCHSKRKDWNHAIEDLRRALDMDRNSQHSRLYRSVLSESLYATGKYEDAVEEMILAMEDILITNVIQYVSYNKQKIEIGTKLIGFADEFLARDECILAIRCYKTMLKMKNLYSEESIWKYHRQCGICQRKLKNFDEAIVENRKALIGSWGLHGTDWLLIFYDLFELLIDAERYDEATDVIEYVETTCYESIEIMFVSDASSRIIVARKKIRETRKENKHPERLSPKNFVAILGQERDERRLENLIKFRNPDPNTLIIPED